MCKFFERSILTDLHKLFTRIKMSLYGILVLLCSDNVYTYYYVFSSVRSPYLATSTPYPSKKEQHRMINGTTGGLRHELDNTHSQPALNTNAKQRWAKAVRATGER